MFREWFASWWSSGASGGLPWILCTAVVNPSFPVVITALLFSLCALLKKVLKVAHVLRSIDFLLHYLFTSLNADIRAKMVLPFDTLITSETVLTPTVANSRPFWVGWWYGQGVLWGHKAPLCWLCFHQYRFCQLLYSNWINVVESVAP